MNSFVNKDDFGSTEIKRKSFWNYRLMEAVEDGETLLSVVEMFYEDGQPIGYTDVSLYGLEDTRQIQNALGLMEGALFKPVMFIDAGGKIKEKE